MKKVYKSWLIAIIAGLLAGPQFTPSIFAAASGNYTDLLPIGAAGNTTVISNGSGWSLTTLPPTQTFGDSLSRVIDTVYQSTTAVIINTTSVSTMTALSGQGKVGSTTFPATWVASGRTIEVIVEGDYTTSQAGSNWTWGVNLGTTSVLTTGAVAATPGQSSRFVKAHAIITIAGTGNAGTVNSVYEILATSGTLPSTVLSFSTGSTITVDLTSQLTVNPVFNWGTANSSFTVRNALVKFDN